MRQHFALTLIGLMLVALLGLTAIGLADKGEWVFETIDPPGGPSPAWNHASGINNRGQIVGSYLDGDIVWHSYLFHKGIYTEMSDPDSLPMGTALSSINDHGQMIGNSIDEGDDFPVGWGYGVLFDRDALSRILIIPNDKQFFTFGINNRGQITGTYGMNEESDYWFHIGLCGFLLDGETLIDISPPDADSTVASIANDHGQIVGDYKDVNGEIHGFLYDKGGYVKIDFPGASESHTFGINNLGQIVGQYSDGSGTHGFLLEGHEFITIDFPGASWTRANGINDHGQIVGNYIGEDGLYHGFMAERAHMAPPALSSHSKVSTTWGRVKAE